MRGAVSSQVAEALFILKEAANGLRVVHSCQACLAVGCVVPIIHRDLTAPSVLLVCAAAHLYAVAPDRIAVQPVALRRTV